MNKYICYFDLNNFQLKTKISDNFFLKTTSYNNFFCTQKNRLCFKWVLEYIKPCIVFGNQQKSWDVLSRQ